MRELSGMALLCAGLALTMSGGAATPGVELGLGSADLASVQRILVLDPSWLAGLSDHGRGVLVERNCTLAVVDASGAWRHRTRDNRTIQHGVGLAGDHELLVKALAAHELFPKFVVYHERLEDAWREPAGFARAAAEFLTLVERTQLGEEQKDSWRALVGSDLYRHLPAIDLGIEALGADARDVLGKAALAYSRDARDVRSQLDASASLPVVPEGTSRAWEALLLRYENVPLDDFVDERGARSIGSFRTDSGFEAYFSLDSSELERLGHMPLGQAARSIDGAKVQFFVREGPGTALKRLPEKAPPHR